MYTVYCSLLNNSGFDDVMTFHSNDFISFRIKTYRFVRHADTSMSKSTFICVYHRFNLKVTVEPFHSSISLMPSLELGSVFSMRTRMWVDFRDWLAGKKGKWGEDSEERVGSASTVRCETVGVLFFIVATWNGKWPARAVYDGGFTSSQVHSPE